MTDTLRKVTGHKSPALLLLAIILLAFLLRVHGLDQESMWYDEVDALAFASRDLGGLAEPFTRPEENGPFFYFVLHFWITLVGTTAFAARFLSLAFGILAIPLIYQLGRRLVGPWTGLLAAGIAALSPYLLWHSKDAKMYSMVLFLTMLSAYLFLRALDTNHRYLWAAYVLVTVLCLYVHVFAVLIIVFEDALFLALYWRFKAAVRRWLISQCFLLLPYLPLLYWQLRRLTSGPASNYPFVPLDEILRVLAIVFSLNIGPAEVGWPIGLFVLLFVAGILFGRQEVEDSTRRAGDHLATATSLRARWEAFARPRMGIVVLLFYFFIPILAFFLLSLRLPLFRDRYLALTAPAFYLLMAAGLSALKRLTPALTATYLVALVFLWLPVAWVGQQTKPDYRTAAAIIREQFQPGDVVAFISGYARSTFAYHYPGAFPWTDLPYTNYDISQEKVNQAMERALTGYRRLWLVMWEEWTWDSRGLDKKWLDRNAVLGFQANLTRLKLYRYCLGVSKLVITVDRPKAGSIVSGEVNIAGWVLDPDSTEGPGVDAVHIYLDGTAGAGWGLGVATYGSPRPDVAKVYGPRFLLSGYNFPFDFATIAPGDHNLYIYAHRPGCGWEYQVVPVKVLSPSS